MEHLQPFSPRTVLILPSVETNGWQLKRYGILANNRTYDSAITLSALDAAIERLPVAGKPDQPDGNHGIGFQLVHFAEVAVVLPVFYWVWGSVLANTDQMRAQWDSANKFDTGVREVVGCVWELEILAFETEAWKQTMLCGTGLLSDNISRYLKRHLHSAESIS